jgi:hypothetical protein
VHFFIIKNLGRNRNVKEHKKNCINLIQLQARMAYVSVRINARSACWKVFKSSPLWKTNRIR